MENQHRSIKGYRELSQEEIELMNSTKELGAELESLIERIREHLNLTCDAAHDRGICENKWAEYDRVESAEPFVWLESGKKDLQVGLMKIVRAVAQPTTF